MYWKEQYQHHRMFVVLFIVSQERYHKNLQLE